MKPACLDKGKGRHCRFLREDLWGERLRKQPSAGQPGRVPLEEGCPVGSRRRSPGVQGRDSDTKMGKD